MKTFGVIRKGKCMTCDKESEIFLGEFEAQTSEEAIQKAQDDWSYEKFGQAGAIREEDIAEEEEFLNGEFIAKEQGE